MTNYTPVASEETLNLQEIDAISLQEAYYALQKELDETKKRNENLEAQLDTLRNAQYEINTQKEYLEVIVGELETQNTAVEIQKKQLIDSVKALESSKNELSAKNLIMIDVVAKLETKQGEVEMQRQYMLEIINELEESKIEISQQNLVLEQTTEIVKRAYGNITDSINYAKRIQDALLPNKDLLKDWFQDYFILFKPTDVVSGDFYWFTQVKNKVVVIVADCTGHGIPGAFMSILSIESLHYIVNVQGIDDADQIVNQLHENTRLLLRQHETKNMDGMDIAVVIVDLKHKILEFAGANNPLVLIKNGEMHHIKADRFAVGGYQKEDKREFTKHIFHVTEGDSFYIYSDGYQDMCGGADSRRFISQRFRRVLREISAKSMPAQKTILKKIMKFWLRREVKHLDDILVMGIQI